jgi:hypothetical protein
MFNKKGQQILDHMGSTEFAANLFRATQTDEKLRREKICIEKGNTLEVNKLMEVFLWIRQKQKMQ